MRLPLKFAELHTPAFIAGTNLGLKLQPKNRQGLKLFLDREAQELHVEYNNETGIIPLTNVACMIEAASVVVPITKVETKTEAAPKVKVKAAQASSPMDHVFEGPGHGKMRD